MALSYPFSYGDELTPEMARLNRLNLFLSMTAFLLLAPKPAQAQFAHGFGIIYLGVNFAEVMTLFQDQLRVLISFYKKI